MSRQLLLKGLDYLGAMFFLTFGLLWIIAQNVTSPAFTVADNDFFGPQIIFEWSITGLLMIWGGVADKK